MEHKVESFEIAGRIEMLVGFDVSKKTDIEIHEWHGIHEIINEDTKVQLTSIEIVIAGKGVDILPFLNRKQRQEIIDNLPI